MNDDDDQVAEQLGNFTLGGGRYTGVTYRQKRIRCGKLQCGCAGGRRLHGPYWFAFDRSSRKWKYVGKFLPAEVLELRNGRARARADKTPASSRRRSRADKTPATSPRRPRAANRGARVKRRPRPRG